ncbi:MAG: hypothetical protein UU48_C0004G0005 [Candidatus Uhrbacteria bacterium GW2011_GWF2_41_16]|uniref:DUF5667 domain-containing protein n=2 Tax=Candidatus Uhriibacteriota TaxID=1752732 RepID=A0A0G0YD12_9BACT|nr:MAG: hypothetical protein UU31_C0008G0010 [Candidatus Uhrbacteria bacterium GW2011_GWA2_41_10]KKR86644.1 MAG: hypothetical protein UU35_C0010G0022 [Candidatus Uhrbacteria bacterium GW2011_GWC2_41_11]KKR98212.1 MAG: hypothetical protein UU48_C0004G0005 [Candidatus Uhrbacteria bacterium GW2011_GWF2_41_16]HBP00540.1 hypothetical protein [Candidatus Uhrbacteria bacterium]
MKNFIHIFALLSLLVLPFAQVQAAITKPSEMTEEEKAELQAEAEAAKDTAIQKAEELGVTFTQYQEKLVQILELAIDKLDTAEETIEGNEYISDVTEDEILDALSALEGKLQTYKTQTNNADSMDDLEGINKQIVADLKANKDAIKTAIQESVLVVAAEAEKRAEQIKIKVESILELLKISCPDEKTTIESIESQLEDLNALAADLKIAVDDEDVEEAKSLMKQMADVAPNLVKEVKEVVDACEEQIEDLAS